MEKADILEMTVAHLRFVHSARRSAAFSPGCRVLPADVLPAAAASSPTAEEASGGAAAAAAALRYLMGYNECVREVASYLAGDDREAGAFGEEVRISLMRHLDDCLRSRATAEPVVAAVVRLPSPGSDRFTGGPGSVGTSSPPPPPTGATAPWRQRCDSGVYSGASSPAQGDELAATASPPSPLELTTTTTTKEPSMIFRDVSPISEFVSSSDVWRPW